MIVDLKLQIKILYSLIVATSMTRLMGVGEVYICIDICIGIGIGICASVAFR